MREITSSVFHDFKKGFAFACKVIEIRTGRGGENFGRGCMLVGVVEIFLFVGIVVFFVKHDGDFKLK